jgi:diguanylate cyclase (GGDEF)-like protein/PAS domain S-box-containing protein
MNHDLYKQILDQSPFGYAYHKIIMDDQGEPIDYQFIEINNAFEKLTGLKGTEVIGKKISEIMPDIRKSQFDWIRLYGNIAINGGEEEFEQYSQELKKWYKVKVYSPEKEYFITAFTDITNEHKQIDNLYKLTLMSEELLEGKIDENYYQKITDNLQEITEAKFVSFNLYEQDGQHYTTMVISGDKGIANKAMQILGIKLDKKKWPHDALRAEKIKEKIVTTFPNLHELAGEVIPKPICDLLTKSFKIGETVVVKIMKNNLMLGDFTLIMPKDKKFEKENITEIFANQVGLAIINMREEEKILSKEEQYRLLTTKMQLGLVLHEIICDDKGKPIDYRFISVNDSYEKITGLTKENILGKTVLEVLPDTEKYWIEFFGKVALTGKEDRFENYSAALGKYYSTVVYSPKKGQFAVIVDDITDRKKMEKQIYNEKEQLKTTLLSVGDGVISVDASGNVVMLNKIAEQLTGWTQEEAQGQSIEEIFNTINTLTEENYESPVKTVLETGKIIESHHKTLISKEGIKRHIEDSAAPIKDQEGNITGVVLVFSDFTEKKKSLDEITYLSFHDHLTGLYNRGFFETELARLDTKRNLPLTIIMGDVNGLKLINDTFGHFAGDELLKKVAEILKKTCRTDDIIARVGGDEYAILLPKTEGTEAQKLINRIIESMKNEKVKDIDVSISFGWASKTDTSQNKDMITKKAEDFMYRNKLFEGPSFRGRVIDNIVLAINEKSPREEAHSKRVSDLCVAIGEELNLKEGEIKTLRIFGLLHDIGKIAIADDILNKPGELTEREYYEIKRHSEIGFRILSTVNDMSEIANYVLFHHERWDGKGYPKGIKGEGIPLPSRICTIVDAYDAMTSDRSYRPAMTNKYAIEELRKNSGTQFDPDIVDVFLNQVLSKINTNVVN